MNVKQLISQVKKSQPNVNIGIIKKAYFFADTAHHGQKRASKENYIKHPLNVSFILSKIGMDLETIIAGLLHDVLEDTNVTYNQLEHEFGANIASLVDGVTKISKIKYEKEEITTAQNLRKFMIATSKDIRVIIIKLADRLHNMRTLEFLPKQDQLRIARDTMEIYAPIAYRLGITEIKSELEDLSFKYLQPVEYKKIQHNVTTTKKERSKILDILKKQLEKELARSNIKARIEYRIKNIYSIHKKITERNYDLDSIKDLIALRVITTSLRGCYEVLGIVNNLWKPIEDGIRDYIASPRPNMYQSIYTQMY